MNEVEKAAGWVLVLIMMFAVCLLGVGVWGFIEIVQWVTSK